jgi:hypothetical protein
MRPTILPRIEKRTPRLYDARKWSLRVQHGRVNVDELDPGLRMNVRGDPAVGFFWNFSQLAHGLDEGFIDMQ